MYTCQKFAAAYIWEHKIRQQIPFPKNCELLDLRVFHRTKPNACICIAFGIGHMKTTYQAPKAARVKYHISNHFAWYLAALIKNITFEPYYDLRQMSRVSGSTTVSG